ncbi:MAG: hypothetical protein QXJ62_04315 [Nitrososphaeria archaeon]
MTEDYRPLFNSIAEKLGVEPVEVECHIVKAGGRARGNKIWFSCEVVAAHEYVHALQFSRYTPTIFSLVKSLAKSFFRSILFKKSVNLIKAYQEGFAEYVVTDILGYSENTILARERSKAAGRSRIGFATSFFNSYVYGLEYYRLIEKVFGRNTAIDAGFSRPEDFRKIAYSAREISNSSLPDLV